jgi:hypothetical protein
LRSRITVETSQVVADQVPTIETSSFSTRVRLGSHDVSILITAADGGDRERGGLAYHFIGGGSVYWPIFAAKGGRTICGFEQWADIPPPNLFVTVFSARNLLDASQCTQQFPAMRPVSLKCRPMVRDRQGKQWWYLVQMRFSFPDRIG